MPYTSYYLTPTGELRKGLTEAEIRTAFQSEVGLLWVDISDTTPEDGEFLDSAFQFHPLSIENCVDPAIHNPKVEDFSSYLFMILRGIDYTAETDLIQTTELNIFVGRHFVVSNHNVFLYSVDAIIKAVEQDSQLFRRGAAFLTHALIDSLVDNVLPTLDRLGERLDYIEEQSLLNHHPSFLEAIVSLKRSSLRLRRAIIPQRHVLSLLGRREFEHIVEESVVYFRDVFENVMRIEGINDNLRERADTALSIHLAAVANRQNETMKLLSIMATIFLPLSLVAGIYGMNFVYIPELAWRWGYFAVLGFMATVITGVVWWFWARNWITVGRRRIARFVPSAVDPEILTRYIADVPWRRRN